MRKTVWVFGTLAIFLAPGVSAGMVYYTATEDHVNQSQDCQALPWYAGTLQPPEEGAASENAYAPIGFCPWGFTYVAETPFSLQGDVRVSLFLGCDVAAVVGGIPGAIRSYLITLFHNDDEVGVFDSTEPIVCDGAPTLIEGTVPAGSRQIAVGDRLDLEILFFAVTNAPREAADNVHILTYSNDHLSGMANKGIPDLRLPDVVEEIPETIEETVEGASLEVVHDFDEATSDTYVFNWSHDHESLRMVGDITPTEGTATITTRQGEELLYEATVEAAFSFDEMLDAIGPGTYVLEIEYQDFTGTANVSVAQAADNEADETADDGAGSPTSGSGSEPADAAGNDDEGLTFQGTDDEPAGEESPGFTFLAVLAAVAAGVVVLRRRKQD